MSKTYRTKEQARTYWQGVLKRWPQSRLSAHRFCRVHQISDSGFYTWRKKLAVTPPNPDPDKTTNSPFVQVAMPHATQSQLTLELSSGHALHIPEKVFWTILWMCFFRFYHAL